MNTIFKSIKNIKIIGNLTKFSQNKTSLWLKLFEVRHAKVINLGCQGSYQLKRIRLVIGCPTLATVPGLIVRNCGKTFYVS